MRLDTFVNANVWVYVCVVYTCIQYVTYRCDGRESDQSIMSPAT